MKRSKELFEYLSQHGMYTRQPGEGRSPGEEPGPDPEGGKGEALPETAPRAGGPSRPRSPRRSGSSFGDQTLVLSYNNIAVGILFGVALMVLAYFLGFSQGIGEPEGGEVRIRMDSPLAPGGTGAPEGSAGGASEAAAAPGPGAPAPSTGFLEAQRVVYSVRAYTAKTRSRVYAEDHLKFLIDSSYDARLVERGDEVIVYVGRFDEPDSAEIHKLVDTLRAMKRHYPDTNQTVQPFATALVEEIRP